jgi:cytochrome P450
MTVDGAHLVEPRSYMERGYPHAAWKELRSEATLRWFEPPGWMPFWAIVKHADIIEISKQPEIFLNAPGMTAVREEQWRAQQAGGFMQMRTIINMDQPDHRKFRKVASPYFTPRGLKRLDEIVDVSARELVDSLGREGECDFIRDVASLHPLRVLAHILGVPREDEPFILKLTNELFGAEDPEFQRGAMKTPEERQANMRALGMDFFNYFNKVVESRRAKPSDDLASVIANARVDGAPMNLIDTMGYSLIVFTAGHETTRGGIGGAMLALLEHPDQLAKWQKDPGLADTAIDEILRYVTPVNHMQRTAAEDYTLRGKQIRKGDRLVLFYGSANRDEEVFDRADELQLDRDPNPHLAFGIGEHFCIGSHLARKTTSSIYRELLTRLEHVELVGKPERTASNLVPGLKHLPIRYRIKPAAA